MPPPSEETGLAETAAAAPSIRPSRRWRPLIAASLSLAVPGAGQWYLGRRLRAAPLLVLSVGTVAAVAALWARGWSVLVPYLVQPGWVRAVVAANVALGLLRLGAALDAFFLGRGHAGSGVPGLAGGAVVTFLVVALVAPHLFVGTRAASLLDLLESVFVGDDEAVAAGLRVRLSEPPRRPDESPSTTALDLEVPSRQPLLPNTPDGLPRPVRPSFVPAPPPDLPPIDLDRVTVLLAGGDAGPGRSGLRTDTIIVASIDLSANRALLISVSRELTGFILPRSIRNATRIESYQDRLWDLAVVAEEEGLSRATQPLPEELDPCCWLDRINALYPATRGFQRTYPDGDPGMEALRESLELTLGINIDFYALVDMAGFVDLVDAIGGIEVTSLESMHVRISPAREGEDWIIIEIEPGRHHFDGRLALAYVRNRSDSNDMVRTRRQRCLLRELAAQVDPYTVVRRFEAIATAIKEHTTTNIPLQVLPDLVAAVASLRGGDIVTVAVQAGTLAPHRDFRGLPVVDPPRVRAAVADLLEGLGSDVPLIQASECDEPPGLFSSG